MFKIRYWLLLAAVVISAVSCATTGSSSRAPAWVANPDEIYSETDYISAVGFGPDRAAAESAAVAALVKM